MSQNMDATIDNETEALPPRIFLLVENPKKSNNLGAIFRCAAAFSVTQIVLVGYEKCNTEGSHGAAKHVDRIAFPSLPPAVEYLRECCGCGSNIMGLLCNGAGGAYSKEGYSVYRDVEKGVVSVDTRSTSQDGNNLPKSYPSHTKPFVREGEGSNFCIVLDKNWRGFSTDLAQVCDFFLHVPHVKIIPSDEDEAKKDSVLLDVPSCLSISLHHLTQWAGYHERVFQGHKFDVAFVQRGRIQTFQTTKPSSENRAQFKQVNELAAETTLDGTGLGGVFGDNDDGDY